jgi:hypothetical protein
MYVFRFSSRLLQAITGAILGLCGAGCQTLDKISYEPRSYEVNLGTQNLREELILLNVVRASRYEPLNFTTLSKYTASGTLGAGASAQRNIGIDFELFRNSAQAPANPSLVGSSPLNTVGATGTLTSSNSFDLAPLDNADFYENFLATLTPQQINILVNAGLSREAVFYSLIDSIDINLTEAGQRKVSQSIKPANSYTKLRFKNDPSNDSWEGVSSKEAFSRCEQAALADRRAGKSEGGYHWAPFYTGFWLGKHLRDCHYHKFLLLVNEAFQYGVTTAAVPKPPSPKASNPLFASATAPGLAARLAEQADIILCFDPAIAADYGHSVWPQSSCAKPQGKGGKEAGPAPLSQPLVSRLGAYDQSMQPVLRSPYGVFQYYGKLLRTGTEVKLPPGTGRETEDRDLFQVTGDASGCFVQTGYAGRNYCIPGEGAAQTKEVLTLLIALVNLSTVRSSLPYTSSVISQR